MLYGKKDRREASYLEPIFGSRNEDEVLPSYHLGENRSNRGLLTK